MEAQAAHAEPVPVAQRRRLDARIGDGDAAQPLRKARQRIEQHAVVEAVRIALHHDAAREAEMIEQRDVILDRRVGRRIAAPRRVGEFVGRPEDMRVRVPGAGRRHDARRCFGCATGPAMRGGSWVKDSTQLDVGFLHHFAPALHLLLDEGAEFFRRVLPRIRC